MFKPMGGVRDVSHVQAMMAMMGGVSAMMGGVQGRQSCSR